MLKQFLFPLLQSWSYLGFTNLLNHEEVAILSFLSDCTIININAIIKKRTITLRKNHVVKLPDAIIAATSQFLGIPLVTADKGFDKIEEVVSLIYENK